MMNDCLQRIRCCRTNSQRTANVSGSTGRAAQCARSFVTRAFPFLTVLRGYSIRLDFPSDVIAGLTVGIMHVPQGMAYALLADLPPVYGLYTAFFPPVIYFFFSTSPQASVGSFSVVCMMVGEVVKNGVEGWTEQHGPSTVPELPPCDPSVMCNMTEANTNEEVEHIKLAFAMSVSFAAGLFMVLLGAFRVGRVASFMSDALISGLIQGAAVHVLISQLPSIFGIAKHHHDSTFVLFYKVRDFLLQLRHVQWMSVVTSLVSVVVLVVVKEGVNNNKKHFPRLPAPIPVELLLIITATLVSYYMGFEGNYDVKVVGPVSQGIPRVDASVLRFVPQVMSKAFTLAAVVFALSFATSKVVAEKHAYRVDANQELVALGMVNVLGPLFSCYCSSVSMSRTVVLDEAGGKTQIASLVSALLVLFVLLFIGPYFHALPICVLATIVIVSLKRLLLQWTRLPRLWKISSADFAVWLVVFGATISLNVDVGLLIGLIFSILAILFRTQTPYVCLLGQIKGTEIYADINGHVEVQEVPGVKIFRFEGSLYFGNVDHFRNCLEAETGLCVKDLKRAQTQVEVPVPQDDDCTQEEAALSSSIRNYGSGGGSGLTTEVKAIVVDGSMLQTLDSLTLVVLTQIINDYKNLGIDVFLAECKPAVKTRLETVGFYDHVNRDCVHDTIHQAVHQALTNCTLAS